MRECLGSLVSTACSNPPCFAPLREGASNTHSLEYLPGILKTGGKTPPPKKDQEGRQDPALAQAAWEHQLPESMSQTKLSINYCPSSPPEPAVQWPYMSAASSHRKRAEARLLCPLSWCVDAVAGFKSPRQTTGFRHRKTGSTELVGVDCPTALPRQLPQSLRFLEQGPILFFAMEGMILSS